MGLFVALGVAGFGRARQAHPHLLLHLLATLLPLQRLRQLLLRRDVERAAEVLLRRTVHDYDLAVHSRRPILGGQFLLRRNRIDHHARQWAVVVGERDTHEILNDVLGGDTCDPLGGGLQVLDKEIILGVGESVGAALALEVQEVCQRCLHDHRVVVGDRLTRGHQLPGHPQQLQVGTRGDRRTGGLAGPQAHRDVFTALEVTVRVVRQVRARVDGHAHAVTIQNILFQPQQLVA